MCLFSHALILGVEVGDEGQLQNQSACSYKGIFTGPGSKMADMSSLESCTQQGRCSDMLMDLENCPYI